VQRHGRLANPMLLVDTGAPLGSPPGVLAQVSNGIRVLLCLPLQEKGTSLSCNLTGTPTQAIRHFNHSPFNTSPIRHSTVQPPASQHFTTWKTLDHQPQKFSGSWPQPEGPKNVPDHDPEIKSPSLDQQVPKVFRIMTLK
jgi:hypothetical protein